MTTSRPLGPGRPRWRCASAAPVLAECREWALSGRHLLGTIVGGMTPDERRREWRTRIPHQGNHTRAGLRAEMLALIISQPGWPAGYIESCRAGLACHREGLDGLLACLAKRMRE